MTAGTEDSVARLLDASAALCARVAPPLALPVGALAPVVAGALAGLSKSDWLVAGPRERVGATLRGASVDRLAEAAGARPYKLAPSVAAPGHRALHAVGLALSSGQPTLCFLGNASSATGAFHEALNSAALTGARVIFLLVQQALTAEAPIGRQLAADPLALAAAFGIPTATAAPTADAVAAVVSAARENEGPSLILVKLPRN
jgi:2-oxoisovalerate dehydrogenase E1 component alpha subunit